MYKTKDMKKSKFPLHLILILVFALFACTTAGTPKADTDAGDKAVEKEAAITKIKDMIASGEAYTVEDIMPHYDQLDPVDLDFMLGTWKGGKFDGGKEPDPINWYGKRFNSRDDVEPLLAQKPDGTIYSFDMWGMAVMREINYRGKVSASLIYNQKPIMDYFRKIDDNTLIGLGEVKGNPHFFFYLMRQKDEG